MLLLLPLDRKIEWKKPPLVTLALILACCLVYFFIQGPDQARWRETADFYFSSVLPELEIPAYIDYLHQHGDYQAARTVQEIFEKKAAGPGALWVLRSIQGDRVFNDRLEHDRVITVDHPEYEAWRAARNKLGWHYRKIVTPTYIFHYGDPLTYFTAMFLHGSIMHLVGNMVFLFIVGFTVERILGAPQFLVSYLLGGLLSMGLWAVVRGDTGVLGASGAISAVMGMYAVLFGLRRIRFFYLILFYFDYVKAPALILLPFWIANEFYGLYMGQEGIGYIAHIGGFTGGSLIALTQTRVFHSADTEYLEKPERDEEQSRAYEHAMNLMGALKFDQAKKILLDLHHQDPSDETILRQLYTITRDKPESEEYHRIAGRILKLRAEDPGTQRLLNDTFEDYSARARPAMRLQPASVADLARYLARGDYAATAERIVAHLMRKLPTLPELPDALLALTEGFRRTNQHRKYERYLKLLTNAYPDSDAAKRAQRLFRS